MTLAQAIKLSYPTSCREDPATGGCTARIDDRGPRDCFPEFCEIAVAVRPDDTMTLTLRHPPLNDEVRSVVDAHGGRIDSRWAPTIVLDLPATAEAARIVRGLAAAIKGVTRRGQRYLEPNWKWLVPRAASSLAEFARLLAGRRRRPEPTA